MQVSKLTNTEKGYMPHTNFKTLIELPYDFIRQNSYEKVWEFDAKFYDFEIYDPETDEYIIIHSYRSNNYITREQYKLLRKLEL